MPVFIKTFLILIASLFSVALQAKTQRPFHIVSIEGHNKAAKKFVARLEPAYQALGYEISLTFLPYQRSLHAANAGEFDAELARSRGIEQKFPNMVMVPVPAIEYASSLLHRRNDKDLPDTILALNGPDLAYLRGTEALTRLYGSKGAIPVSHTDQIVKMVSTGRIRYGMAPGLIFRKYLQEEPGLDISPIAFAVLYHYVHKKHADIVPFLARQLRAENKKHGLLQYTDTREPE